MLLEMSTERVDLLLSNDEPCYKRLRNVIIDKYKTHDRSQLCAVVGGWIAKLCVDKRGSLFKYDNIDWSIVDYNELANDWVDKIIEEIEWEERNVG